MGTLDFYDSEAERYAALTLSADVSDVRDRFIMMLPRGASVLDLGCGSGRDTFAFSRLGFEVTPVDGSRGMCAQAERYTGMKVRNLLFEDLDYEEEFDGVWAHASLLHVSSADLPQVLSLVRRSLKKGGMFFTCFKKGDFEGEREGRMYTDMTSESLRELLEDCGFSVKEVWERTAAETGVEWVNALSVKD